MLSRLYAIAIKQGTPAEVVEELVSVLDRAPEFIPSMRWSTVRREESPNVYELVWHNGFEDRAGYQEYLRHPYHGNVIDHYMYPESPESIITPQTMCLRWGDGEDDVVTSAPGPADAADALARSEHPPEDGPLGEPALRLWEHVELVAGKREAYLRAVREIYLPHVTPLGLSLRSILRSPDASGEDELELIWDIPGWAAWTKIRTAIYHDKEWLGLWLDTVEPLRVGGRRRLLIKDDLDGGSARDD